MKTYIYIYIYVSITDRQKLKRRFYSKNPISNQGNTRPKLSGGNTSVKGVKGIKTKKNDDQLPVNWETTHIIQKSCVMHAYNKNVRTYVCGKVQVSQVCYPLKTITDPNQGRRTPPFSFPLTVSFSIQTYTTVQQT